ncbi:MAG: anthranilate phosphoribosyltransferase [Rhodospirillales bacterium]|nr:anthranilate phosphoribosyltransferase [Rhodospirillales bacterium]
MKKILSHIRRGHKLSEQEMIEAMNTIMSGGATDAQLGAFLMGLAVRGETVEEITGAARVMREKAFPIKAPADAIDCCGTGGDGVGTYNVSTAVALVAAACGVPMAKHGNRAASSKSGAADVLEALGVNLTAPHEKLEEALKRFNFAFLMAPQHHEAMKYVVPVRKELGCRTIFNLLGPLANPAGTRRQLIGVFDPKWLVPMAQALKNLGTEKAWIVYGSDHMDEITVTGPTKIAVLEKGDIFEKSLKPGDFGLPTHKLEELVGGTAAENAAALRALLDGKPSAYRDIVLANAAAVLLIHGTATNLKDGVATAAAAIDSGKARKVLENYAAFTNEAAA